MSQPRIVFCTTCRGRAQHIEQTLPRNIADNASYDNAAFVVLDYGDPGNLETVIRRNHLADLESGRLIYYRFPTSRFIMAHAKNMAMRCGMMQDADILVTLDADNFTGPGLAQFIALRMHDPGIKPTTFLYPDFLTIKNMPWTPERPLRGFAGRLAIWAQDFIKLGGYDEKFNVWGSEDIDMLGRLKRGGYTGRFFNNENLHVIPHGPDVRFKEYPDAKQYENKWNSRLIDARTETVVNWGRYGLGTVYRDFEPAPIAIKPLPTRVFGIGLHRTGTTSLHEALTSLKLDSFHWGTGESPLIWQEMQALGRSKTLEQRYALSDLPIPLLYKELDKAYPGSKFILTVRDPASWLASVERLWDNHYNPTRWMWDVYPFSNYIHTMLYGRKDFDAQVFLARYMWHNTEVLEYFKDRPEDLLVMDMEAGAGWPDLCEFLGLPMPTTCYPHSNKSGLVEDPVDGLYEP